MSSFPFEKGAYGVLVNCSLCGAGATRSYSTGSLRSSFSAEACALVPALRWPRQHKQVCCFSSPTLRLSLCLVIISSPSSFLLSHTSVTHLVATMPFLLFYTATMELWLLVSSNDRGEELVRCNQQPPQHDGAVPNPV